MAYRSDKCQLLANYFDAKDVRTRSNPCALDSQLLNTSAVLLDDASIRYIREINSLSMATCPTNLDNGGVYYTVNLDSKYVVDLEATSLNTIVGIKDNQQYSLNVYNDLLPIPEGYHLDTTRQITQVSSTVLANFTGDLTDLYPGTVQTSIIDVQLPIVNKISFDLTNLIKQYPYVDIVVTGYKYPEDVWNNSVLETENVVMTSGFYAETKSAWTYIHSITVRFLPNESFLTCRFINFDLSANYDPIKLGSLPDFRDFAFDKYWYLDGDYNSLIEANHLDDLTGLKPHNYYNLADVFYNGLAIEPNTWGALVGQDTSIVYIDRRTPIEANLVNTGLKAEPLYGLDIVRSVTEPTNFTTVVINPIAYYYASQLNQFRLFVETPTGNLFAIHTDGSLSAYTGSTGWMTGVPQTVKYVMDEYGEYVFHLQMTDINGVITEDIFIYANKLLTDLAKATCDISDIVLGIQGIAYDFFNQLWVWDGFYAYPLKPFYNSYMLDPIGRKIYLTENWDSVEYS